MGLTAPLSWCRGDDLRGSESSERPGTPPSTWVCPSLRSCWLSSGAVRLENREGAGVPWTGEPHCDCFGVSPLLQEGQPLGQSQAAGDPQLPERLADTAGPAAGRDVLYPLPLAPGLLPAALPPAGRQQTLMHVSA